MAVARGTKIGSPLTNGSENAVFGTHRDFLGIGGYRAVPTLADRNSIAVKSVLEDDLIASGMRRVGMLVYVVQNNKTYQLQISNYLTLSEQEQITQLTSNDNWKEVKLSVVEDDNVILGDIIQTFVFDESTNTITITTDQNAFSVDVAQLANTNAVTIVDMYADLATKRLVVTFSDGSQQFADLSGLLTHQIDFVLDGNFLTLTFDGEPKTVDLSSVVGTGTGTGVTGDTITGVTLVGRTLTINTDKASYTADFTAMLNAGRGDTISTITLDANHVLTVTTDRGDKSVDLSSLVVVPVEAGDTVTGLGLVNTTLSVVTDKATHEIDLASILPAPVEPGDTINNLSLDTNHILTVTTDRGDKSVDLSSLVVEPTEPTEAGDTITSVELVGTELVVRTDKGDKSVDLSGLIPEPVEPVEPGDTITGVELQGTQLVIRTDKGNKSVSLAPLAGDTTVIEAAPSTLHFSGAVDGNLSIQLPFGSKKVLMVGVDHNAYVNPNSYTVDLNSSPPILTFPPFGAIVDGDNIWGVVLMSEPSTGGNNTYTEPEHDQVTAAVGEDYFYYVLNDRMYISEDIKYVRNCNSVSFQLIAGETVYEVVNSIFPLAEQIDLLSSQDIAIGYTIGVKINRIDVNKPSFIKVLLTEERPIYSQ